MSVEEARKLRLRTIESLLAGELSEAAYRAALDQLAAIRDAVEGLDQRILDADIGALETSWEIAHRPPPPESVIEADRLIQSAWAGEGSPEQRLARARAVSEEATRLWEQAPTTREHMAIGRMLEPLAALIEALEAQVSRGGRGGGAAGR